jgi:hypothetical protein
LGLGGFTRRCQSGWLVGKLTLKLMRGKDLIKKHKKAPPFLSARADYEKLSFLKFFIFCQRKKGKEKKAVK